MKRLLFIVLVSLSFFSHAQLDREHWFAPMIDRVGNASRYQSIYLSTNETVPFNIDVYQNNAVIATVAVSKGSPVQYKIPDRSTIITTLQSDLFTPVTMGFYLKGEKPFYATLRFSILNHGEIVTSKGSSGLGTDFRAVMAPITAYNGILNFMTSILATRDNTQVSVTEFNPDTEFSDGIPRTQFNITLQKGQSYIIDGFGDTPNNLTGFIGAKITSNEPISVTNGNFNGQYATASTQSSDILMDQAVPTDKLGQEFVLVKGNGLVTNGMETAIVVATEDQTKIYLNGGTSAVATLDAGEHYLTDASAYQNRGFNHYNMHLKADKNVYVYQLLAGDGGSQTLATGGFNYIPPLSCYLPKRIEEIGKIDENEYVANGVPYTQTVPTKLNITTEKGASVEVWQNGTELVLNPQNGPFTVGGTPNWVTYSVPNISGNVSIISSRAVTAGISAGNGAVGYGGYFAGFSYIPAIFRSSGECLPDAVLEVTADFDSYEWLMKTDTGYVAAPGINTQHQYKPTQAGIYAVKLKEGSCNQIQTPDYKFFNCDTYTNDDYDTCTQLQITPAFALSSQTYNPTTVSIQNPPTKGTATVGANGIISYTANPNASGIDTFKFSFCGLGAIADCETVQATVHLKQIVAYDAVITACSSTSTGIFDLYEAAVTPDAAVTKTFFRDAAFSDQITAADASNYISTTGFVHVKLKNAFPCFNTAKIELKLQAPPVVQAQNYTQLHCDEDIDGVIDGIFKVDLLTVTPVVLPNSTGFTVKYYESEAKAIAGGSDNVSGIYSFSRDGAAWIRVESPACPPEIAEIKLKSATSFAIVSNVNEQVCDNDLNSSEVVTLSSYTSLFTSDTYDSVSIFDDLSKAQQGLLADQADINQTVTSPKTFYYRFKKAGFCEVIGTLKIELKQPRTSPTLIDKEICENATTTLDAGENFTEYLWSTGEKTRKIDDVKIGEYWVDLSSNGCVYRQYVKVTRAKDPEIVRIEIQGSTVTVHVTGGNPPYRFALDGGSFQDSNVFTKVSGGTHTVSVISAESCDPVTASFYVMQLYNAISPNGDGINDRLDYSGLMTKEEAQMQIFDRFGNLIFKGDATNRFIWNGTLSGKNIATGTFWYVLRWREPSADYFTEYTGWILVKNRN